MDRREFMKKLFEKGKQAGMKEMEIYFQDSDNFDIKVFKGEIDNYSISNEIGVSFRGLYNGKMGYSYTEKIDETSIDILIKEAVENASVIDSDDEENIQPPSENYKEVNNYNNSLNKVTPEEKINFIKSVEKEAFKLDNRVISVQHCIFGEESAHTMLVNTKELDLEEKSNIAYAYVSVMVKEGEDVKTGGSYIISNDFSKFDAKKLAKEAVDEAVSMLGAKSIESNEYPIVLRNDVAANLLEAFVPIFSAENVQKDLSLLKGKIDKQIGNSIITVVDDPFMKNGVASASFDGEGVSTKYKKVIDKGILKTYLHNTKTAKKDGVESTGNAYKPSYKSPVSIAPTNMYIEKGNITFNEIIESIDKGLLIINIQGLHAGLNTVSGDFSLSAYGYLIENGKIDRPVNQITIAGNFFELLKDIEMIGDDLRFTLPGGSGYIGSPTLKIKKLAVSGD
ncbi:TldD/PmbA family protein [Caldisalinibacter kiritimatiensis]|uniref:TldE/PmbA protein, part of proposed TldE/TldD proteolytic complex n=1 Tax=Caldisalinibacter kiritimatiensis TaxID=1304284 RepID=R1CGY5_9FIRM|nr:TldD/PmbA family protein [Caldisalinibacter kiritimatiensis]EOD01565.1 TldE/PmbA protein, part of proposed TldE/TldD proteolytic complex [Caldisalinibacter kiritimatiensis]